MGDGDTLDCKKFFQKRKARLIILAAWTAALMVGCRDVSQKNDWIVQAVFEKPEREETTVKLLCRTAESEEGEYKLFFAQGEEGEDALKELKKREGGSFYFGHCELLFLDEGVTLEQAEEAAEFWQEPENGCGNMTVYLINMGQEAKEEQEWKGFFAQLERLHKEQPVTAWAHKLAGEEDCFLIPQLLWEEDGVRSDGVVFFGDGVKERWEENHVQLAGVLLGQKNSLTWQSGEGTETVLEPVTISYAVTNSGAKKAAIVLDAFGKGHGTEEERQALKEEIEEELKQMVRETLGPGKDIFAFARRAEFTGKEKEEEQICRVNVWQ